MKIDKNPLMLDNDIDFEGVSQQIRDIRKEDEEEVNMNKPQINYVNQIDQEYSQTVCWCFSKNMKKVGDKKEKKEQEIQKKEQEKQRKVRIKEQKKRSSVSYCDKLKSCCSCNSCCCNFEDCCYNFKSWFRDRNDNIKEVFSGLKYVLSKSYDDNYNSKYSIVDIDFQPTFAAENMLLYLILLSNYCGNIIALPIILLQYLMNIMHRKLYQDSRYEHVQKHDFMYMLYFCLKNCLIVLLIALQFGETKITSISDDLEPSIIELSVTWVVIIPFIIMTIIFLICTDEKDHEFMQVLQYFFNIFMIFSIMIVYCQGIRGVGAMKLSTNYFVEQMVKFKPVQSLGQGIQLYNTIFTIGLVMIDSSQFDLFYHAKDAKKFVSTLYLILISFFMRLLMHCDICYTLPSYSFAFQSLMFLYQLVIFMTTMSFLRNVYNIKEIVKINMESYKYWLNLIFCFGPFMLLIALVSHTWTMEQVNIMLMVIVGLLQLLYGILCYIIPFYSFSDERLNRKGEKVFLCLLVFIPLGIYWGAGGYSVYYFVNNTKTMII